MQDDTKQIEEVNVTRHMAKRTAKNSVFLDLFQNKFPPFVSRKYYIKFGLWHFYFPAFVIVLAGTLKIFVITLRQIRY